MRVVFYRSDKPREGLLAEAIADGAKAYGDDVEIRYLTPEKEIVDDCEVAVMVGVKSRELFWKHWQAGIHTVYLDKGYTRQAAPGPVKIWEYWRVSVDSHSPTTFLCSGQNMPSDRLEKQKIELKPWRKHGAHIVFAGSSAKYHDFYGMHDPTRFANKLLSHLKRVTQIPIIYRPKPSWRDAEPIEGAGYSTGEQVIDDVLPSAHALITHGSNACFEAVLAGVPCVILGEGVAKPISSREVEHINSPLLASMEDRTQWLSNLMYCQWTLREFASGEAWAFIRPQLYGPR